VIHSPLERYCLAANASFDAAESARQIDQEDA
jgi:hypothetical protein